MRLESHIVYLRAAGGTWSRGSFDRERMLDCLGPAPSEVTVRGAVRAVTHRADVRVLTGSGLALAASAVEPAEALRRPVGLGGARPT